MQKVMSADIGNNRIHPQKFAMWLAIGSMVMMFAGLTSSYLVHMSKGNWKYFNVPTAFWFSTAIIIVSSVTMTITRRQMAKHHLSNYRFWLGMTFMLGLIFLYLQYLGFTELYNEQIRINGVPSESLFYIIPLMHGIHVIGGLIAMQVLFIRSKLRKNFKNYNKIPIEILSIYWHFVDLLWVYLFVFFILTQQFKI